MTNVFVGNMSFQTSESELRAAFEAFGQVTGVHIVTDRDTGRARGFAFVEMANAEEASKAIAALNGQELNGRALKVNEARPRPERGAGGPGRGPGGPGRGPGGPGRGPGGTGRGRGGFSKDDYHGHARQPREPRW